MTLAPEPWNVGPYLPGVSQLWIRTKIIKFLKISAFKSAFIYILLSNDLCAFFVKFYTNMSFVC